MATKKVLISIDEDLLAALDKLSSALEIPRSRAMQACIESALDDFAWIDFVGVTPRQLKALATKLRAKKQLKFGSLLIDISKFWRRIKDSGLTDQ